MIDCHDRDLIGRRYATSADTALCLGALHDAVWERFPDQLEHLKTLAPQLSHDWGSQFTSRRYCDELKTLGIRSRPTMIGCPEHNGIKERFFGALKDEQVWPKEYDTRAEAIASIDAWIDFYRTERPHQSLGYLTPAEYRAAPLGSPPEAGRPPVLFSPTGTLPAAKYALPASTGKVSGSGTGNCKPAATPKPKPKPRAGAGAGAGTIELRPDAHDAFLSELRERQRTTIWATGGCSSWYLDDRGRDPTNWPGYTLEYRRRVRRADSETYALGAAR